MNESRINLENLPFFLCFGYKTVFLIFQKQLWSFGIRGTSSLGLLSTYFPRTWAKRTHVLTFNQYISDVYVDVGTYYMAIFFCYISTIIYKNTNTYQDLSHMHASLVFNIFNIHITYLSFERTFLTDIYFSLLL